MRKIVLLSTALLFIAIYGESKDLTGAWKEVKRVNVKTGTSVSYKDTMFLKFQEGNEYVSQKKNGFIYKGTYKMTDNTLDLGSRMFTILKHTKATLKLQDEEGIYEFELYTPEGLPGPMAAEAAAQPVSDITVMKGHWSEFKRTSKNTLSEVDYQRLIKMMDVFSKFQDGNYGYIFATRDADNNPSWHIDSYDARTQILHCSGRDARELHVLRCQDNELRIEENGVTYFFKKFKQ